MIVPCPHSNITTKEVTFRNGTKHLERRCSLCKKHMGYAPRKHGNANIPARLHFGKYKGRTFLEVALKDRDYLTWLSREIIKSGRGQTRLRSKIQSALDVTRDDTTSTCSIACQ